MLYVVGFYLACCAATLWAASYLHDRDRRHARQIAMMFAVSCVVSNSTLLNGAAWSWPALDAGITWFVAVRQKRRPRAWKWGIMEVCALQQVAHVVWWIYDNGRVSSYIYHTVLNGLFVAQLAYVAFSGSKPVGEGLRDCVADWLGPIRRWRVALLRRRQDLDRERRR